jgi:hypothetical protein
MIVGVLTRSTVYIHIQYILWGVNILPLCDCDVLGIVLDVYLGSV